MIVFHCTICEKEYKDVELNGERIIYMDGNKRLELKDKNDPCASCQKEILEEATQKVRARKQQASI